MARNSTTVAVLLIAGAMLCNATAEGTRTERLFIEIRAIAIPLATAVDLIPELTQIQPSKSACAELDRLIVTNGAELLDTVVLWASPGVQATSATSEEFRYPCELDPPQIAGIFGNHPSTKDALDYQLYPRWGPLIPTAFETRPLGFSAEVTPTVRQGGSQISLNLSVQLIRFAGFREYKGIRSPLGTEGSVVQPDLDVRKVTTEFLVDTGTPQLLCSFIDENLQAVLFTIRVTPVP